MKLEKNVGKLVAITICQSLVFAYVIERMFALQRGLTILDMQYLLIFYSMISFILEIPSGVMADLWKKKYTLALGLFICTFEFIANIFAYDVFHFSLAYLAAAIGGAFKSGTVEAILYQSLKELNQESDYVRWKGRLKFIKYFISGVSSVIGGYLAEKYGYEMNYWCSIIGLPIAGIISLSLFEPKNLTGKNQDGRKSFISHLKAGMVISWNRKELRKLLIISGIVSAVLNGELHEMSMLIYPEISIKVAYFGYISLGITAVAAVAGLFSIQLDRLMEKRSCYILTFLLSSIAIFLFGTLSKWWAIFFLFLVIGMLETLTPVLSGRIQEQTPDHLRVTIASVDSFMYNMVSIIIGFLFGFLADQFSIHVSFQLLAVFPLVALLFNLKPNRFR